MITQERLSGGGLRFCARYRPPVDIPLTASPRAGGPGSATPGQSRRHDVTTSRGHEVTRSRPRGVTRSRSHEVAGSRGCGVTRSAPRSAPAARVRAHATAACALINARAGMPAHAPLRCALAPACAGSPCAPAPARAGSPCAPARPGRHRSAWASVPPAGRPRGRCRRGQRLSRPPEKICRKNRKTFRMSRKMEAASNGADSTSDDRRSLWKSMTIGPTKIASPAPSRSAQPFPVHLMGSCQQPPTPGARPHILPPDAAGRRRAPQGPALVRTPGSTADPRPPRRDGSAPARPARSRRCPPGSAGRRARRSWRRSGRTCVPEDPAPPA